MVKHSPIQPDSLRFLLAVLFDAAGTLIRLREPVGNTYARMARASGARASAGALDAAFRSAFRRMPPMAFPGRPRAEVVRLERAWWSTLVHDTFAEAGARVADLDALFDRLFAHYGGAAAWQVVEGGEELLRALRAQGLRTGMVSNFDHRLPPLLDALGLAPLLDVVVLPANVGVAKPDARIFQRALELLAVPASEAAYVGNDTDEDIAGARAAGMTAIDVRTLGRLGELANALAG